MEIFAVSSVRSLNLVIWNSSGADALRKILEL